jgi:ABC-type phosphate transport system substrate-binding protein
MTSMKLILKFVLTSAMAASLVAAIVPTATAAAGVQVVANSSVKAASVSNDDLKAVFLGTKKSLPDGSNVEPVLAESGAAHDAFLKDVLGKSDQALRNYFKTLVFTGKGSMPKSFASDAEIIKYVAKTPGAIGYVSASADAAGVKKIAVN